MAEQTSKLQNKLKELDQRIQKYYNVIGFNADKNNTNIEEYFSYSRTELESLTPNQIAIIIAEISLNKIFLQKSINKTYAFLNWLKSELERYIGSVTENYSGYWQEKRLIIINSDSYCNKLYKYIMEFQVRHDSMYDIAKSYDNLCSSLNGIKYIKSERSKS